MSSKFNEEVEVHGEASGEKMASPAPCLYLNTLSIHLMSYVASSVSDHFMCSVVQ